MPKCPRGLWIAPNPEDFHSKRNRIIYNNPEKNCFDFLNHENFFNRQTADFVYCKI